MSWKEIRQIGQRLQFAKLALRAQESMSQLCRRFGFSRKTGYKWKERFEAEGARGLSDQTRRPRRSPKQTSKRWLVAIRRLRRRHATWGARKLRVCLRDEYPRQQLPAERTIGCWLKRLKLARPRQQRSRGRLRLSGSRLTGARWSNHVWTVDFKGWFRTQDGQRMEPLTVRDLFSRYLLTIRLLKNQRWQGVREVFGRLFRRYGYPLVIRVDNGSPFGNSGAAGLSRLSAWWTTLGIRVEFITPGHPQDNGGHEQMHKIFKAELTKPASRNRRAQQRRTDRWRRVYNELRPHEGVQHRRPGQLYRRGRRRSPPTPWRYPSRWVTRRVKRNGEIKWQGRRRYVGEAFVGYEVGLKPLGQEMWAVYFGKLLIGQISDLETSGMCPARYHRPIN